MEGTVKRLVRDKQFGFILGDDKAEYFFHKSALQNVKYEDLKEGDRVSFDESETSKGFRAENVFAD